MKKAKIMMALLMLFGMASSAEAQIVVSQTTASTTKVYEKSGREKGWVIRPEAEFGAVFRYYSWSLKLHANFTYQFNPYFTLGAGTGFNSMPSKKLNAFPLYANARFYFCDRQWSPFFDVKVGLNIPLNNYHYTDYYGYDYEVFTEYTYKLKGIDLCGTLGIQYKNFDFGCTVGMLNVHVHEYERYEGDYNYSTHSYTYLYDSYDRNRPSFQIAGYVAYNIPVKIK